MRTPPRLTAFGRKIREFRLSREVLLSDQAEHLGVSSAYVSAIETGAKGIPTLYVERLAEWLRLTDPETAELHAAADRSSNVIRFRPRSAVQAEFANDLSRRLHNLNPGQIRDLKKCLLESVDDE